jgi:hypothetical protein
VNFSVALRLGRVSNLPTVWTNMLAAMVLSGGTAADARALLLLLALTLFYVGGMYLNDAFDADIDARERPERPIPAGEISRTTVFVLGFGMLALALAILVWLQASFDTGTAWWPFVAGIGLAAAIVFYDWYHKANPLSPLVMGLCRVLVYVTTGLCFVIPLPADLLIGAALLLSYLIGLTYVAKQENLGEVKNMWPLAFLGAPVVAGAYFALTTPLVWLFWIAFVAWIGVALRFVRRRGPGDIPRAVISLIAGICLFDAMLVASQGSIVLAVLAIAGFGLTLAFQKFVSGT